MPKTDYTSREERNELPWASTEGSPTIFDLFSIQAEQGLAGKARQPKANEQNAKVKHAQTNKSGTKYLWYLVNKSKSIEGYIKVSMSGQTYQ